MKQVVVICWCLLPFFGMAQRGIVVTGTVSDNSGGVLPGASITIRGQRSGTTSDNSGFFRIRVQPGASICVNAVGFRGDTVMVGDGVIRLDIVLEPRVRLLEGIVVTGTDQKAVGNDPMHVMVTRSAGATISEFLQSEMSFNGQTIVTPYKMDTKTGMPTVKDPNASYLTNTPANTYYRMSAVPSFTIKEDVKGSRYLLGDRWGQGVVVTADDSLVDNRALRYNFDKIQQKLYATKDLATVIELDEQHIKAFAIRDGDSLMIFDRVGAIDSSRYFLVIVAAVEGKYSLYRDIRTKFAKSDYHSDGMTETGTPYDEYVDNNSYFLVLPGGLRSRRLEMRKKYLKEIIPEEKIKVDEFFSKHRYDAINETLLKELILFLDDQPRSLLTLY